MAESMQRALMDAGFASLGLCGVCTGRAFKFQYNGLIAKVKVDQYNREIATIFEGKINGLNVYNEGAILSTIDLKLKEYGFTTAGDAVGS